MKRIIKFIVIAFKSLLINKSQALLTMMGIIIGISSVILMISVGKGAESLILTSVQSFGNRNVIIRPGGGNNVHSPIMSVDRIKYKDFLAMKSLDYVEDVAPFLVYQSVVTFGNQNQKVTLIGSNENYPKAINSIVQEGHFMESNDVTNASRVAVIDFNEVSELFGDQNVVGRIIKINGKNFTVIGRMEPQGARMLKGLDKIVIIPITTMKNNIFGVDYLNVIMANAKGNLTNVMADLRDFFRTRHAIDNPENDLNKDDFKVISQIDATQTFEQIASVLTMFLVLIATISLLVGGIGIMNIMLVAVSERTREIGIRKAVGASNFDIMVQFLIESVVLTFVAGFLGILVGIIFSYILALVVKYFEPGWQFIITTDSILLAFGVSATVGLIFGIYPAQNASQLDPIECLRSE